MTPRLFATASAALVRSDISRRSFSASAAYRCSMNGSASAPSSATMNGRRCVIKYAFQLLQRCRCASNPWLKKGVGYEARERPAVLKRVLAGLIVAALLASGAAAGRLEDGLAAHRRGR